MEVDLDQIQIDVFKDRQAHDQNDRVHEPTFAVIEHSVAGCEPSPSDVGPQTTTEASVLSIDIPPTAPATLVSEPVSETPPGRRAPAQYADQTEEPAQDEYADETEEPAQDGLESSEPPLGDPAEQEPTTGPDPSTHAAPELAQGEAEVDDAATSPSTRGRR